MVPKKLEPNMAQEIGFPDGWKMREVSSLLRWQSLSSLRELQPQSLLEFSAPSLLVPPVASASHITRATMLDAGEHGAGSLPPAASSEAPPPSIARSCSQFSSGGGGGGQRQPEGVDLHAAMEAVGAAAEARLCVARGSVGCWPA